MYAVLNLWFVHVSFPTVSIVGFTLKILNGSTFHIFRLTSRVAAAVTKDCRTFRILTANSFCPLQANFCGSR